MPKTNGRSYVCRGLCIAPLAAVLMCFAFPARSAELFQAPLRALTTDQQSALDRIRSQPTTGDLQPVTINFDALQDSTTTMTLPDRRSIGVVESKREINSPAGYVWHGLPVGGRGYATLVVRDGNVTGSIVIGADFYNIVPVGSGMHVIIKVDASRLPPEHPPRTVRSGGTPGRQPAATGEMNPLPRVDTGPRTIDVLVAYTASAVTEAGSSTTIDAMIGEAVAEANLTYANSDISIELNLVHTHAVASSYSDKGKSLPATLADLVAKIGALREIHELRDQYGADLVLLLTGTPDPLSCGQAQTTLADVSSAFAVAWQLCAKSPRYSLAHELGHLMGAQHDPVSDQQDRDARFTYGHGYQFGNEWRTIMADPCPQPVCTSTCDHDPDDPQRVVCTTCPPTSPICPRIPYWSNPQVVYGAAPTGTTDESDNAAVLRATATTIAGFKNRPPVWSVWENLGGTIYESPKCVSAGTNQIACFINSNYGLPPDDVRGPGLQVCGSTNSPFSIGCYIVPNVYDGFVRYRRWNGRVWSEWQALGAGFQPTTDCVTSVPDRIDCFGVGSKNNGIFNSWTKGGDTWQAWENLGGQSTNPSCIGGAGSRIDCLIRADDAILHRSWNGSAWSDWQRLPSTENLSVPQCIRTRPNQIDCFALGDGVMYHGRRTDAGWSDWESLGPARGQPLCFGWGATNRIECFTRGADNTVQHRRWNGSVWSEWQTIEQLTEYPACVSSGLNRIDCFGRGHDGALLHRWGAGSAWSAWESLGGTIFETPSCISPARNRIDCFARGEGRAMFHISGSR